MAKTTVSAALCEKCQTWVYSRATHDFRRCPCGSIYVDGGLDYMRMGFKDTPPQVKQFKVDADPVHLYNDWNKRLDHFGFIKNAQRS